MNSTSSPNINQPLVSIIMPAYNHEKYVESSITSIINQTYKNVELIVIDDCSKDKTKEIIKNLQKKYNFMFIEHTNNQGISKTLNEGLKLALGEYFCVLASDDQLLPEKIETNIKHFRDNPQHELVFSNINLIDTDNQIIQHNYANHSKIQKLLAAQNGKERAAILMEGNCIPVMTVMTKRESLLKIGGFDESSYIEDWDAWIRLARNDMQFGYINKPLVNYRITPGSMSKNLKFIESQKSILLKHADIYPNISRLLNKLNTQYARYYFSKKEYLISLMYIYNFILHKLP